MEVRRPPFSTTKFGNCAELPEPITLRRTEVNSTTNHYQSKMVYLQNLKQNFNSQFPICRI